MLHQRNPRAYILDAFRPGCRYGPPRQRSAFSLSLDNSDVDWSNGVLSVRRGKSGAVARIIPVSESTSSRLRAYAGERDRLLGRSPTSFFVSDDGARDARQLIQSTDTGTPHLLCHRECRPAAAAWGGLPVIAV